VGAKGDWMEDIKGWLFVEKKGVRVEGDGRRKRVGSDGGGGGGMERGGGGGGGGDRRRRTGSVREARSAESKEGVRC